MKWLYADFCTRTTIADGSKCNTSEEKHGDSLKKKTAFSACDDFQRSLPCPVGADVFGGTSNRSPRGLDETP